MAVVLKELEIAVVVVEGRKANSDADSERAKGSNSVEAGPRGGYGASVGEHGQPGPFKKAGNGGHARKQVLQPGTRVIGVVEPEYPKTIDDEGRARALTILHRSLYVVETLAHIQRLFFGAEARVVSLAQENRVRAHYDVHVCQYKQCNAQGVKNKCSGCYQVTYCDQWVISTSTDEYWLYVSTFVRVCQKKAWPEHKKVCGKSPEGATMIWGSVRERSTGGYEVVL
ncbi:hypothetical protein C8F01DRAFT_1081466 [Mycena amicta]|nr:hypothetical protein C8F01DRAFT_1081466 [Mycena amicta]